jgi:hypothetical protein
VIVVEISHGLGNQLFQYAAGRRLAHQRGTVLKLDTSYYYAGSFRKFGLDQFNIRAERASWRDIARLCPKETLRRTAVALWPRPSKRIPLQLLRAAGLESPYVKRFESPEVYAGYPLMIGRVVSERHYHLEPEMLQAPDNVALSGYWQSYKYFEDIEPLIREEISFRTPPDETNRQWIERLQGCESVSLHVRRGDKLVLEDVYGTSLEFCHRAMDFCKARLAHAQFFIFSDDWKWVSENLPENDEIVHVRHNTADYEDLRLMSNCRNNILASSTFSWWGAWLNRNPQKMVVRPALWLNELKFDHRDVFPPGWIKLA